MTIKKTTLSAALIITAAFCFSSTLLVGQSGALPNIMSPEVADLGRYGAYPVSYYSGTPTISIPLYKIKENELEMDLSLSYNASGFVPGKESGIVGQNWALEAGGVITRVVNWNADDVNKSYPGHVEGMNLHSYKGYIHGMKNMNLPTYNKEYIRTLSFMTFDGIGQMMSYNLEYEYSPDVFTFNFNGHSGSFFLGNDGEVRVLANKKYKVNLSGFSGQLNMCEPANSEISITTDDGYLYKFGGDINTLDITYSYLPQSNKITCEGVINAWRIKSITTPDGRSVVFDYQVQSRNVLKFLSGEGLPSTVDYAYEKIFRSETVSHLIHHQADPGSETRNVNTIGFRFKSLIKTCYLSKITTPSGSIDFSYSAKTNGYYPGAEPVDFPNKSLQLNRMLVRDYNNVVVKDINLSYQYFGDITVSYRLFLDKVQFANPQNAAEKYGYQFQYYKTGFLPSPLTQGLDMDGYFNGMTGNTALVPVAPGNAPNYDVIFSGRDANASYADIGMLQKIIFPTGGTTEFIYEGHDYNKKITRTVPTGYTPVTVTGAASAGGLRIKEIKNSNGSFRKFFYKQNFTLGATGLNSSGIYLDRSVYFLKLNAPGNLIDPYYQVTENNVFNSSSYSESPIGYSEVTEITSEGGYKKYFFSSHETNPDIYSQGPGSIITYPAPDFSTTNFVQQMKRLVTWSITSMERGQLLKQEVYNDENKILNRLTNTYNTDPLRFNESVIGFASPFFIASFSLYSSYALYHFQTAITKQEFTEFNPESSVASTRTTLFKYRSNADAQLISKTEIGSKGEITVTQFKYPADYYYSGHSTFPSMTNAFILSPVIERTVSKGGVVTEKTYTDYYTPSAGKFKPLKLQLQTGTNPLETRQEYHAYDVYGNIREVSKEGDPTHEIYIWGYKGQYPVGKIIGPVTYAGISPQLNTTILDNPSTDGQVRLYINNIRTNFPNCQVYTYTYAPLVGITSETDPSGKTTYYEYDEFKRLKAVKDADNNIQKTYDYKYRQ